jgi:hypothetical protein
LDRRGLSLLSTPSSGTNVSENNYIFKQMTLVTFGYSRPVTNLCVCSSIMTHLRSYLWKRYCQGRYAQQMLIIFRPLYHLWYNEPLLLIYLYSSAINTRRYHLWYYLLERVL